MPMNSLNTEERRAIENELEPSERVLWAGKPNPKVIFHSEDSYVIPFSLMWGGFAIFWEASVVRQGWGFGQLWGIPFVVLGQYFIWGRFFYDNWKKRRIVYVLTDRRALVIVRPPQSSMISARLGAVGSIQKEVRSDGIGTITIGTPISTRSGTKPKSFGSLGLNYGVPVFVDIDDANQVYRKIEQIRMNAGALLEDSVRPELHLPSFG